MSEHPIGIMEIYDVINDSMGEGGIDTDGTGVAESMEGLGINFEEVADSVKEMFGTELASLWLSAFHAGLLVASRHWDYRVPNGDK